METGDIERLVRESVDGVTHASVTTRADHPEDDHYQLVVVSEVFEGESLVQQHKRVRDALNEELTDTIHAIELTTHTPTEYEQMSAEHTPTE